MQDIVLLNLLLFRTVGILHDFLLEDGVAYNNLQLIVNAPYLHYELFSSEQDSTKERAIMSCIFELNFSLLLSSEMKSPYLSPNTP